MKKFKELKLMTEEKKDKYDEGEYDQEGDMAKSDLRSIMANAKELHDMIDDADNLPEWCQNKITLAEDYISTVANYLTAEMSEEVMNEMDTYPHPDSKEGKALMKSFKSSAKKYPTDLNAPGKIPTVKQTTSALLPMLNKSFKKSMKKEEVEQKHKEIDTHNEGAIPAKEKTVTVRHKTSGKELVVTAQKAKEYQQQGYHPVKEEVEQIGEEDAYSKDRYAVKNGKAVKDNPTHKGSSNYKDQSHHVYATSAEEALKKHMKKEEAEQIDEKNVPTSPEKWAQAKSQAKAKFDVYPSAYANGWAAKKYKAMGGSWKSVSEATDPPFDKPYTTIKKVVTDKSGAKHSPMSRARDIARMAMKKQMEKMKPVKESLEESRKAEIVKEIMKKKKDKSEDAFQKDPELTTTLAKGI